MDRLKRGVWATHKNPTTPLSFAFGVGMQQLIQFLANEGYCLKHIIPDGKIHRFQLDNSDYKECGWYVCFQNNLRGHTDNFYVLTAGDWHSGKKIQYNTLNGTASTEDKKLIRKQINEAIKKHEIEQKETWEKVSKEVTEKWEKLSNTGKSSYLESKGITNYQDLGIKFDEKGSIYVAAKDEKGKIWSWQEIKSNGEKRFHPGGRISSCFGYIGGSGTVRYISEGFATGVTLYRATEGNVYVSFSASNLPSVAKSIRITFPGAQILCCGDADEIGKRKAEEAVKQIEATAIFPRFKSQEGKPTDWNDLHCREGLEEVKKQIQTVNLPPVKIRKVSSLGFKENEYFFTSTDNKQVVSITAFSERDLLHLMPLNYWEQEYPKKDGVDWRLAKSNLMESARKQGIFQVENVRGAGVWEDDGRVIINMGNHVLIDGIKHELNEISSRYFYTLGKTLSPIHLNPLSEQKSQILIDVCNKFKWKNKDSGTLLAGALVLSRVCGALPVRPHVWITGGAETGKTTILEKLIKIIMGESKIYAQGNTTEAGIRQSLRADAVPVLFDEFETTGTRSDENIANLIELMRASWSGSGASIIKGSASGNACQYQVRFSAIVSSIRTKLTNDADRSRFAILELAPHGSDLEHWKELSVSLNEINEEYSEQLFARTITSLPRLIKNFKLIKTVFSQKVGARFGDQYGMLLAGYSILAWDRPINKVDAEFLATVQVDLIDEKETTKQTDQEDALNHLLTTKIRYEGDCIVKGKVFAIRGDASIEELLNKTTTTNYAITALGHLGIRVETDYIYIASGNHAELESKVWRGTKWSNSWAGPLMRLDGARKTTMRIIGHPMRCIELPRKTVEPS